jgi:hypothetical protein
MEHFTYENMRNSDSQFDEFDEIARTAWDRIPLDGHYAHGNIPELHVAIQFIRTAFEAGDVLMCLRLIHKATIVVGSYLKKNKRQFGMDEFGPAMEYVVVKAKPFRFASMAEYLMRCFVRILGDPKTPELRSIIFDCRAIQYPLTSLFYAAKSDPRFNKSWDFTFKFKIDPKTHVEVLELNLNSYFLVFV